MKLNPINSISFNGKIIDAHAHIGNWQGSSYQIENLDTFSKQTLSNEDTIEKMIVSNLSCIDKGTMKSELEGNLEMLDIASKNPKIVPLAVCQPKTGSVANIRKLFNKHPNKFVGLKFHPDGHEIMASDNAFIPYLKFAKKKKLPCLFHCGIPWEDNHLVDATKAFSSPVEVYKAAQRIPKTPVVMAHLGAGGPQVHSKAIDVLLDSIETGKANLYADISWVDIEDQSKPTIIELIKRLKNTSKGDMTHKILFGSDAPIGEYATGTGENGLQLYEKSIKDIKKAIKNNFEDANELIDKIFYKNANELFFERKWAENIPEINKISKTKIGFAIGTAVLALAGIMFWAFNRKKPVNIATGDVTDLTKKTTNYSINNELPQVFATFAKN